MSLLQIQNKKHNHQKITCLTAYDASFAKIFDEAKIDIILVGDSLGMVIQGAQNTLNVSMPDMVYHTKIVSSACQNSYLVADLPYLSYENPKETLTNAQKLLDAGANMVKLEGAKDLSIFEYLIKNNIPVCGHLGLQPQSILELGGYKVQGREQESADKILENSVKLQKIGVKLLILECIPKTLATKITKLLKIPTIGIGAGIHCDGQVLVSYDILGLGQPLKFTKNFLDETNSIQQAVKNFKLAVENETFPSDNHSF